MWREKSRERETQCVHRRRASMAESQPSLDIQLDDEGFSPKECIRPRRPTQDGRPDGESGRAFPPSPAGRSHAKVVLVGDAGVGKTALLLRFAQQFFSSSTCACSPHPPHPTPRRALSRPSSRGRRATVGVDLHTRAVELPSGGEVSLQLWDTAGQEVFHALTASYFRQAHAVVLMYAVNQPAPSLFGHASCPHHEGTSPQVRRQPAGQLRLAREMDAGGRPERAGAGGEDGRGRQVRRGARRVDAGARRRGRRLCCPARRALRTLLREGQCVAPGGIEPGPFPHRAPFTRHTPTLPRALLPLSLSASQPALCLTCGADSNVTPLFERLGAHIVARGFDPTAPPGKAANGGGMRVSNRPGPPPKKGCC